VSQTPRERRIWFERAFATGLPVDAFPDLVERLRGTPGRLEERALGADPAQVASRSGDAWSIQEHAGHLLDLETLWVGRLADLEQGAKVLRPADLANTKTEEARHNEAELAALLAAFRSTRLGWVATLDGLDEQALGRTALHPRLEQPMTVVDLAFFVAEHDDHHLASITALRTRHRQG
jgi:uncharacterized damage-inducible protein DinB